MTPRETPGTNKSPITEATSPPRRRTQVKPKADLTTATTKTRVGRPRVVGPRPGSKTAKILALLRRPGGVGLKTLVKATGWQAHSIRGFLSGTVAGKMGLKVSSIKADSGERRYATKP